MDNKMTIETKDKRTIFLETYGCEMDAPGDNFDKY